MIFKMASILCMAFLLCQLGSSTPLKTRDYNPNENLVLADCGVGNVFGHPTWSTSFKALYYKGNVWTDLQRNTSLHPVMIADAPHGMALPHIEFPFSFAAGYESS